MHGGSSIQRSYVATFYVYVEHLFGARRHLNELTSSSETERSVATRPVWAGAKAAAEAAQRAAIASFILRRTSMMGKWSGKSGGDKEGTRTRSAGFVQVGPRACEVRLGSPFCKLASRPARFIQNLPPKTANQQPATQQRNRQDLI